MRGHIICGARDSPYQGVATLTSGRITMVTMTTEKNVHRAIVLIVKEP